MPKLDYFQPRKFNAADELRDILNQLENSQPQLKKMNPTQALITLRNLDQAYTLFIELEATGADLAAERGRFDSIQAHFKKQIAPFLKGLGGSTTLDEYRPKPIPPRERWWWYIQELVAAQRQRLLKQITIIGSIIVILVGGLIVALNTVLAPSPEAIARLEGENNALAAFDEGDYETALTAINTSLEVVPNDVRLLTLRGIFLELLERDQEAQFSFEQAQNVLNDPINFHIERGQSYLRTNQVDQVVAEAQAALAIDDTTATAWLLLGQGLELQDNRSEAIAAYEQASELALERGNNEIVVLARLALGRISLGP